MTAKMKTNFFSKIQKYISKKEAIVLLASILVIVAIYSDQRFEPKDLSKIQEEARARVETQPEKDFTTDSCSLWFNSAFGSDFTDFCIEHDIEYWKGGSPDDRKRADIELRDLVNEEIPLMGNIMYLGVRILGHPALNAPWSWGYGF